MYDCRERYRCTIIRGKAQNDIENLLPIYAEIILHGEGMERGRFDSYFNARLAQYVSSPTPKTLNNHRTEIACKLFGMYRFSDGLVVAADRTRRLIETGDLPQFFRSIVLKFQFPNGLDKPQTIQDKLEVNISLRPFHFIVSLLDLASANDIPYLTRNEVAYFVLDSLHVLQGVASTSEVLDSIINYRQENIRVRVEHDGKASSYSMQHINEQLNLLELSNTIIQESINNERIVRLNENQREFIDHVKSISPNILGFDVANIFSGNRDFFDDEWARYYTTDNDLEIISKATVFNAVPVSEHGHASSSPATPNDIGQYGEDFVYELEKNRVSDFNLRLSLKVLSLGRQKGLGYDIQSVWADLAAEYSKEADAPFYIEVKTTARITNPTQDTPDSFNLTRAEWLAANNGKDSYFIYRVYITRDNVFIYKIQNPLNVQGGLCTPINYNYEFKISEPIKSWSIEKN